MREYELNGSYTDCYAMDLPHAVSMSDYIIAFYTSRLFKLERFMLSIALGKKTTDSHTNELALSQTSAFSAWTVEGRESNQLLLRDLLGRTRSWLMAEPMEVDGKRHTRLYFGSAVVPKSRPAGGKPSFGAAFHLLSGFHHLYSRALMRSARSNLLRAKALTPS